MKQGGLQAVLDIPERASAMVEGPPATGDLVDFPCEYVFKVFGDSSPDVAFVDTVRLCVGKIVAVGDDSVKVRSSSGGKFVCVSVVVWLDNATQLAEIYASLRNVNGLNFLI